MNAHAHPIAACDRDANAASAWERFVTDQVARLDQHAADLDSFQARYDRLSAMIEDACPVARGLVEGRVS